MFLITPSKNTLIHSLCIFLFSCVSIAAQNNSDYTLLWKITGKQLQAPSYIFGTMHVDDARAFRFSDAVMPAIENCETFALEVHPDSIMKGYLKHSKSFKKDPKKFFKSLLNEKEYSQLVQRFKEVNGYNFEDSDLKNPSSIVELLIKDTDDIDDKSTFVDMYLLGQARTMRKKLVGLEPIENQLFYFDRLSKADQRLYIMDFLEPSINTIHDQLEQLKIIYAEGNLEKIQQKVEAYDGFTESLISRNKDMVNSIVELIKNTTLFAAVGAAHLPGKEGLIKLIREHGYTVEPVEANFTGVSQNYEIDESKMKWFTYTNDTLGYSLEIPGPPTFEEEFPTFKIHSYSSINDKTTYLFLGMPIANRSKDISLDDYIDTLMVKMTSNYKGTIINSNKHPETYPYKGSKSLIKMQDGSLLKTAIYLKEPMMYFLGAQADSSHIESKSVHRFFNSVKIKEPIIVKKEFKIQNYISEKGAFSVKIPEGEKDMSRSVDLPEEVGSGTMYLNMILSTDLENHDNFLIRYNDMPDRYFLEDYEEGFNGVLTDLSSKSTLLSEPKPIKLDGHKGFQYEILIQEKSHAICQVFFRGNRTYLIMHQKLNDEKVNPDNDFFNSFEFIDYKEANLKEFKGPFHKFSNQLFEEVHQNVDSLNFDEGFTKNSYEFYSTNPNTGDIYSISFGDLQDYFKIDDVDVFQNEIIDAFKNYNDSLILKKSIDKGAVLGVEIHLLSATNPHPERHQIWLEGSRLYSISGFSNRETMNSAITDSIFNSFKNSSDDYFDYFSSKSNKIIDDLSSKDSLVFKSAIGAFSYYDFKEDELDDLYRGLKTKFDTEIKDKLVKTKIVEEFSMVNDQRTVKSLKDAYRKTNSDVLKSTILTTLPSLDYDNAISTYTELLFKEAPKDIEGFQWSILEPLTDSAALAVNYFDDLLKLNTNRNYRVNVIHAITNILHTYPSNDMVSKNLEKVLDYADTDLQFHIEQRRDSLAETYISSSLMYAYTELMSTLNSDHPIIDKFTSDILESDISTWYEEEAVAIRILSNLDLDNNYIIKYTDSLATRFTILKALQTKNRLDEVDNQYYSEESLALMSLYEFLEYDDYATDDLELLGIIEYEGARYRAMKVVYDYEDSNESYLALVGPIPADVTTKSLETYPVIINWESLAEDWEKQSNELLLESAESEED